MKRLMLLILGIGALSLSGLALAQTSSATPTASVRCSSDVAKRPADPNGGWRINLETFVPDPGCWLRSTVTEVENRGLPSVLTKIGQVLALGGFALGFFSLITTGNATNALKTIFIALLCFSMMSGFDSKKGGAWIIGSMMIDAWQTAYIASSQVGQTMLNSTVLTKTQELTDGIEKYLMVSGDLDSIRQSLLNSSDPTDPNTLNQEYARIVASRQQEVSSNLANSSNPNSYYIFIYFLILGLYTIYASIVYSSGLMIVLIVNLMPVILGLCSIKFVNPLKSSFVLMLSNVVTVLLLPVILGILTTTLLTSPLGALNSNLQYNVSLGNTIIRDTKNNMDNCHTPVLYVACRTTGKIVGILKSNFQSIQDAFVGLALVIFALLVSFSIIMIQLRRLPALISQILNTVGGGESSGVITSMGIRAKAAQVVNKVGGARSKVGGASSQRSAASAGPKGPSGATGATGSGSSGSGSNSSGSSGSARGSGVTPQATTASVLNTPRSPRQQPYRTLPPTNKTP